MCPSQLSSQWGVELSIMLPVPSSCFLILHQRKGDEEFPDCVLRDQTLVAKRLMESQGLKEWPDWVTDQGNWVCEWEKEKMKWEMKQNNLHLHHYGKITIIITPFLPCYCMQTSVYLAVWHNFTDHCSTPELARGIEIQSTTQNHSHQLRQMPVNETLY